jgi:hypothetical protein
MGDQVELAPVSQDGSVFLTDDADEAPIRTKMWPQFAYKDLDEGIRFAVRVLHAAGIETCQSCQGGADHGYENATVDLPAGPDDLAGFQALAVLEEYGLDVGSVSKVWNISRGMPFEVLWRVELTDEARALCLERSEELPMFVHGYQAQ